MTNRPRGTRATTSPGGRTKVRGSNVEEVRSHYDLSNDFFRLWQDPTQTYSCAYFERDDMTLEEAQRAKIDLSLGKLGLQPGMTLLDIGCGWGATMLRAIEKHDVNVIGLTLSHNQKKHIERLFAESDSPRGKRVLLQSWEEFDEPVDRIVSIGAFEHWGFERYDAFFKMTYDLMPRDGVMLLHTIVIPSEKEIQERQLPTLMSVMRFIKFILTEIFPGGRLPTVALVEERHQGRVRRDPGPGAAAALHQDARHLGGHSRVQEGRGHRGHLRGGLRAVHEVPDRLRRPVPQGLYRRLPVHMRKGIARRPGGIDHRWLIAGRARRRCGRRSRTFKPITTSRMIFWAVSGSLPHL